MSATASSPAKDVSSPSKEDGSTPAPPNPPSIVLPKANPDEQTEKTAPDQRGGGGEENQDGGEEEEEQGECGFCLYMKGGGCRDNFIAWEKCIEDAEKNNEDIVNKCHEATAFLKKCMEAHSDYYEPILRAEKAAEEQATKEIEEEVALAAAAEESAATTAPAPVPPPAPAPAPAQSEGKV